MVDFIYKRDVFNFLWDINGYYSGALQQAVHGVNIAKFEFVKDLEVFSDLIFCFVQYSWVS